MESLEQKIERLKQEMHDAPLNKVFQDHHGHRYLGTHSNAWAVKSREWAETVKEWRKRMESDK
jgi:hypothetical protein